MFSLHYSVLLQNYLASWNIDNNVVANGDRLHGAEYELFWAADVWYITLGTDVGHPWQVRTMSYSHLTKAGAKAKQIKEMNYLGNIQLQMYRYKGLKARDCMWEYQKTLELSDST